MTRLRNALAALGAFLAALLAAFFLGRQRVLKAADEADEALADRVSHRANVVRENHAEKLIDLTDDQLDRRLLELRRRQDR